MTPEERLDALDALLLSLITIDDGMHLSEFDGFCTGIVVSPELIPPSEWLPLVWGKSNKLEFDTEDELQAALDLIMAHYNDVAKMLAPPIEEFSPVYDLEINSDETFWESWVCGFEQAMRLRPDCWEALVDGDFEQAGSAVLMMIELYNIADGKTELSEAQIDELTELAPEMIPELVFAIDHWTKSQAIAEPFPSMMAANYTNAPFAAKKVGRNEPCSCGSRRKYKKCCGLQ